MIVLVRRRDVSADATEHVVDLAEHIHGDVAYMPAYDHQTRCWTNAWLVQEFHSVKYRSCGRHKVDNEDDYDDPTVQKEVFRVILQANSENRRCYRTENCYADVGKVSWLCFLKWVSQGQNEIETQADIEPDYHVVEEGRLERNKFNQYSESFPIALSCPLADWYWQYLGQSKLTDECESYKRPHEAKAGEW